MSRSRADSSLTNPDIAPTSRRERTWNMWHFASLWVGMSVCIPTYMLAAGMIRSGMSWGESLLVIFLGNAIVLVPLTLNAHAGARYGIPFPVFVRAPFGIRGAHLPSLLRSLVACGWFGIQTWIGGTAISVILGIVWPGWSAVGGGWAFMGYGLGDYLGFAIFWAINMYFVWAGTESIKWLEVTAAPFLIVMGLALLLWAVTRVGGLWIILEQSSRLIEARPRQSTLQYLGGTFVPWLTAMVGYWATLSLNIPDFTRYARSQKDQILGQGIGLLTAMPLYAFIGIAVTSATLILYGEAIWNPVTLMERLTIEYESPLLGIVAMLVLVVATLSTNIAANVVAPANSFSNLAPDRISFRAGGLLAGAVGIVIMPWKLLEMYQTWLIAYSGLLGAVAGVLICDYYVMRRTRLNLEALYSASGEYAYGSGFHWRALSAMALGTGVALTGRVIPGLGFLFSGSWFSATAASFALYYLLMRRRT